MQQSSSSIGTLAAALARAQVELVNPEKSMVATIRPDVKGAAEQIFRYAPLSSGLDIVRKTLGQHEIATVQTTSLDQTAGIINLKTVLAHSSGEWISSDWPVCSLEDVASPKRMGAALTYARRYALFALVGIAGEDDLDAPDLNAPQPAETERETPPRHKRAWANGSRKFISRTMPTNTEAKPNLAPVNGGLRKKLSAVLRDRLLGELKAVTSAEGAAIYARRILPAKNSLDEADARQLEEAFESRLAELTGQAVDAQVSNADTPYTGGGDDTTASEVKNAEALPLGLRNSAVKNIDKSQLAHPEPRRLRDKDHLRFVANQPCLVCGRMPADPHHLRFTQHRAFGRKVSDEWVVALCRGHHREVHRHGNEAEWWKTVGIDPTVNARALWLQSHPLLLDPALRDRHLPGSNSESR